MRVSFVKNLLVPEIAAWFSETQGEKWVTHDANRCAEKLVEILHQNSDDVILALQGYTPWDEDRNQDELCKCGHPYYRHFDTYDNMLPVGCKYCMCLEFEETS